MWVRIEGGGGEGGNERVKTKTEWVSMRVLDAHAKKQMKCKQTIHIK